MDDLKVFTGNSHPALAKEITNYLDIPLGRADVFEFSNENIFVRIWKMSVKGHLCCAIDVTSGQ